MIAAPGGITLTDAARALETGTGAGVRVAIIDSGVEIDHPDLAGLQLEDDVAIAADGLRVTAGPGRGLDLFGHGTAIASIIRRIAPGAAIGSFRVLDDRLAGRSAAIREGVRQALERGYHVLNCSFGCRGEAQFVMGYKEWVDEAYLKGVHIVAACNNSDFTMPEWPAYFPSVIAVNMARVAGLSFYYLQGQMVEFAAAGEGIEVPWRDGARKKVTGSSYATPHMAAIVARLLSVYPGLPTLEVKALLHRLAEPFRPEIAGGNVRGAGPSPAERVSAG